jgi:hypothetical protein
MPQLASSSTCLIECSLTLKSTGQVRNITWSCFQSFPAFNTVTWHKKVTSCNPFHRDYSLISLLVWSFLPLNFFSACIQSQMPSCLMLSCLLFFTTLSLISQPRCNLLEGRNWVFPYFCILAISRKPWRDICFFILRVQWVKAFFLKCQF